MVILFFKLLSNQLGKDYVRKKFFAEEGDEECLCCKDFWITTDYSRSFLRFGKFRPGREIAYFAGDIQNLNSKVIDSILSRNMSRTIELIMTKHSSYSNFIYKNLDKKVIESSKFKIYQVLESSGSFLRIQFDTPSESLLLKIDTLYHTSYISISTNTYTKLIDSHHPNERECIQIAKFLNNRLIQ